MRRNDTLQHTPAEARITQAIQAVEGMAADERLTAAIILLQQARDKVADFVDGVTAKFSTQTSEIPCDRPDCAEVRRELDEANAVIEGYGESEPPIVKGALDAQAAAEKDLFAACEEIKHLKRLLERECRDTRNMALMCEQVHLVMLRQLVPMLAPAADLSRLERDRELSRITVNIDADTAAAIAAAHGPLQVLP